MHRTWQILVGIAVLGCKDPPSKPSAGASAGATGATTATGSAAPAAASAPASGGAATSAPAVPRFDDTAAANAAYDGEVEDADWATNTERAIKAAAPELTDVDCKQRSCRATLGAANETELMHKVDQLNADTGLRGTEARSVLLTAPQMVDGKPSMQIFIRYDR